MGSGSVMVNGGVYINNDGIETFLKNIKDISDSFDNIQKRIKKVKISLENDFDGITPTIIDYAQVCVDLSDKLRKNADYIHTKSQKIVKIADDAEINALAQFDALEAIKQRIAALLASVGSFITPFYALGTGIGLGSVIGGLLGGSSGNSSYGGSSHGGGGSGGNRDSGVNTEFQFFYRGKDGDNDPKILKNISANYKYDFKKNEDTFKINANIYSKKDLISVIHITDEHTYDKFSTKRTTDIGYADYSIDFNAVSDGSLEFKAKASATALSNNGKINVGNVQFTGGVGILNAIAVGSASIGKNGINGNVNVGASVAKIEGEVAYKLKSLLVNKVSLKPEAKVITAEASAGLKAGKDGFGAKAKAEASLAKATATGEVDVLGGIFTLKGTAGVNAGFKADAGASAENGKLELGGELAALGDVGVAVIVNADVIASEDNQWYTKFSEGYEKNTGHSYKDDWYTGMDIILDSNPLGQWFYNKVVLNGYIF